MVHSTDSSSKSNECTRAPSLRAASENSPLPEPISFQQPAERLFCLGELIRTECSREVKPVSAKSETMIPHARVRHSSSSARPCSQDSGFTRALAIRARSGLNVRILPQCCRADDREGETAGDDRASYRASLGPRADCSRPLHQLGAYAAAAAMACPLCDGAT